MLLPTASKCSKWAGLLVSFINNSILHQSFSENTAYDFMAFHMLYLVKKKIHKYVYDFHGKTFYYKPSQESQKCLQFNKICHVIAFMK